MAGLEERLRRLEVRSGKATGHTGTPYYIQRFLKELANLRRVDGGLDPLPYTPEDLEDDERCLLQVIPVYRAEPGWQSGEARNFLDRWEQHLIQNLQRGVKP